eukprot:augustus_masked-scaffold_4-processed-gene-13.5-mRNA-1 protein AED:1.00 eAED:1.00 QI:0/-1/0/0/-1/1/1/0/714
MLNKIIIGISIIVPTYAATGCTGYPSASPLDPSFTSIQEANSLSIAEENVEVLVQGIVTNDLRDTTFRTFVIQAPASQTDGLFSDYSQGIEVYCRSGDDCLDAEFVEGQLISFSANTSIYNSVQPQLEYSTDYIIEEESLASVSASCPPLAAEVNIVDLILPREEGFDDTSIQNMLVNPVIDTSEELTDGLLTLTNTYPFRYGQLTVSSIGRLIQPSSIFNTVDEAIELAEREELNERASLILDDRSSYSCDTVTPWFDTNLPGGGLRTGITLEPSLLDGVGTYQYLSAAGSFMFRPSIFGENIVTIHAFDQSSNERPESITVETNSISGLRIASFNMLNYFTTLIEEDSCSDCRGADTAEEFALQSIKLYKGLAEIDAAVVGLQEVQNLLLETEESEDITMDTLISELNTLVGNNKYDYIKTGVLGNDAIRVAMIYQPNLVTPIGDYQSLEYINPIDKSRTALAQTFQVNSVEDSCEDSSQISTFTVVNNHFKSKGSACDEDDSSHPDFAERVEGEGNCGYTRLKHSTQLIEWLQGEEFDTSIPQIIVGDLNSYGSERVMTNLANNGFFELSGNSADSPSYSYSFDGLFGSLDHILISDFAVNSTGKTFKWHINSDEAIVTDYTVEQYFASFCDETPEGYQDDSFFRNSDHDPAINFISVCGTVEEDNDLSVVLGFTAFFALLVLVVFISGVFTKKTEEPTYEVKADEKKMTV